VASNSRRRARIAALRALYQWDVGEEGKSFAKEIVYGVIENIKDIDNNISLFAEGYALDRLATIDRALLRIAVFELLFSKQLSPAIVINEAVELAKRYSTEKSGAFVNGILGKMTKQLIGEHQ
jgi:N utilization substance protein B